ncbi:hypothetical protein A6A08_14135 [Nocardiopsis sp. TSRI0078]|nr:hypothetical protein A6A08_14135 [Nocardiopsis sp. TSRI0078]
MWALTAALLAVALAAVFVPQHPQCLRRPQPQRAAITPPPHRRELPPAPSRRRPGAQDPPDFPADDVWRRSDHRDDRRGTDPDEAAGALVRPYMPPLPRIPVGDLLAEPSEPTGPAAPVSPTEPAAPSGDTADDMGDLAAVIRLYLDRVG